MSLVKVKTKYQVTLPTKIGKKVGIDVGDYLEVKIEKRRITLTPKLVIDRSKFPTADDEYTPRERRIIDARLAKADEDIKHGRVYGPFDTHEKFIASLHKEAKKLHIRKSKRAATE